MLASILLGLIKCDRLGWAFMTKPWDTKRIPGRYFTVDNPARTNATLPIKGNGRFPPRTNGLVFAYAELINE